MTFIKVPLLGFIKVPLLGSHILGDVIRFKLPLTTVCVILIVVLLDSDVGYGKSADCSTVGGKVAGQG